jgi:hypothetical protein
MANTGPDPFDERSNCHNGIWVNKPPEPPFPGNGADVADCQLWEFLRGKGVRSIHPETLESCLDKLQRVLSIRQAGDNVQLRNVAHSGLYVHDALLSPQMHYGGGSFLPLVGEGHWRAIFYDKSSNTVWLFDPYGARGWGGGISARIFQTLEAIVQLSGGRMTVRKLDFRVQNCSFQCGVWTSWFGVLTHTFVREHPNQSLDAYMLQVMLTESIVAPDITGRNADAARTLRAGFREFVTNPRFPGEAEVGVYSSQIRLVRQAHYALEEGVFRWVEPQRELVYPGGPKSTVISYEYPACGTINCQKVFGEGCCIIASPSHTRINASEGSPTNSPSMLRRQMYMIVADCVFCLILLWHTY